MGSAPEWWDACPVSETDPQRVRRLPSRWDRTYRVPAIRVGFPGVYGETVGR